MPGRGRVCRLTRPAGWWWWGGGGICAGGGSLLRWLAAAAAATRADPSPSVRRPRSQALPPPSGRCGGHVKRRASALDRPACRVPSSVVGAVRPGAGSPAGPYPLLVVVVVVIVVAVRLLGRGAASLCYRLPSLLPRAAPWRSRQPGLARPPAPARLGGILPQPRWPGWPRRSAAGPACRGYWWQRC